MTYYFPLAKRNSESQLHRERSSKFFFFLERDFWFFVHSKSAEASHAILIELPPPCETHLLNNFKQMLECNWIHRANNSRKFTSYSLLRFTRGMRHVGITQLGDALSKVALRIKFWRTTIATRCRRSRFCRTTIAPTLLGLIPKAMNSIHNGDSCWIKQMLAHWIWWFFCCRHKLPVACWEMCPSDTPPTSERRKPSSWDTLEVVHVDHWYPRSNILLRGHIRSNKRMLGIPSPPLPVGILRQKRKAERLDRRRWRGGEILESASNY